MREILFRGQRKDNGEWVYGDLLHLPHGVVILANGYANIIPETVGQFTGLTDKNGTKIFEGDIVKLFLIDGIEKGVIKFDNTICRFMFYDKSGGYGFDDTCVYEIIGNIHDNPELMEVQE